MERLRSLWSDLSASLWFVPALIVLAAVSLAAGLIEIDALHDLDLARRWPRLFGAGAEASRAVLSTIASSVITVAGVVFSITIVALSLAASQYSPRVLRGFMRDRPTQVVLGTFVGIFAYALVVLRTIRTDDEGGFVPSLAILGGIALAFVGIGLLVYFIHHVAASIQASSILARAAAEARQAVDDLFPENLGEGSEGSAESLQTQVPEDWTPIPACEMGYIVRVDQKGLLALARETRRVIRMERGIGAFVIEGCPLASLSGKGEVQDTLVRRLNSLYVINTQRTVDQDAAFGIQQIVDVALKGLSPGINDSTTAVMCIDYLTAVLFRLVQRRIESGARYEGAELRVIAIGPDLAGLVALAYDAIRRNAAGNVDVLAVLIESGRTVALATGNSYRRALIARHIQASVELAQRTVERAAERAALAEQGERALREVLGRAA